MNQISLASIKTMLRDPRAQRSALAGFMYWFFTLVYLETLLHAVVFDSFSGRFGFVVYFCAIAAGCLALIGTFLPEKARLPVDLSVTAVLIILFGSQLVYRFIFGTMYSVAQIQQGGDALTSFWRETLLTMWEQLPTLLLLLVPILVLLAIRKLRRDLLTPSNWAYRLCLLGVTVLAYIIVMVSIAAGGKGYFTNYYFYHSPDTTTTQTADRFGLLTAFRLELLGSSDYDPEDYATGDNLSNADPTPTPEVPVEYNVLEIDFDAMNALTEDETILALNETIAGLTGTNKNEYTGMLKDYNLIVLCAESFATGAIHPELTPTLYKLANEGIIFNNYYNTWPNNTTDGEYSLVMGLYPDSTRDKVASSFYASRGSYLPFVLGNAFSEQADIQPYGYHNYLGSFYARNVTHPNLGYDMQFALDGMTFTTSWPSSDLEMMEQSIDDYISQEQFHAYYMTFSGHFKYDVSVNPMAARNWKYVQNLDLSYASKAYLSCNIELEKAMAYLMERLEEAGIADKTAIVLTGDHFPYGLSDKQYDELVAEKVDKFNKFKSTLIFWVGGLEEPIVVDEYCCNVDILPTILNLWGFEFDSRMLAGTDVFSDGQHIAVLSDKSFYTDKLWFNASSGEVKYLVDQSQLPAGYLESMIKLVKDKFALSVNILNTAYYNFIFDQGSVHVNRHGWTDWNSFNGIVDEPDPTPTPEVSPEVSPDVPAASPAPDMPAASPTPDVPVTSPDVPAATPTPPATTPEAPAVTPEPPATTPEPPAVTPEPPAVTPEPPAAPADTPAPPPPETPADPVVPEAPQDPIVPEQPQDPIVPEA